MKNKKIFVRASPFKIFSYKQKRYKSSISEIFKTEQKFILDKRFSKKPKKTSSQERMMFFVITKRFFFLLLSQRTTTTNKNRITHYQRLANAKTMYKWKTIKKETRKKQTWKVLYHFLPAYPHQLVITLVNRLMH